MPKSPWKAPVPADDPLERVMSEDIPTRVRVTNGISLGLDIGIGLAIVGTVFLILMALIIYILYSTGLFQ